MDLETTILALESDPQAHVKYYLAQKMHKRLLKVDQGLASAFKNRAQEIYSYAPYFEGRMHEMK